jgi:cobalt-precorrin-5B (C1)-methyltransferase
MSKILECVTTDAAVDILKANNRLDGTMQRLMSRIEKYTGRRACDMDIGTVVFSQKGDIGTLGMTDRAEYILSQLRKG